MIQSLRCTAPLAFWASVLSNVALQRAYGVWEGGGDDVQILADGFGVAGQVYDQFPPPDAGNAAGQHARWGDFQTRRSHCFSNPWDCVVDRAEGCLRGHVARGESGPAGGEDQVDI